MRKSTIIFIARYLALSAYFILFFPKPAYAYLDPGSGSYVIQMLIALGLGLAFAVRGGWQKIKSLFTGVFARNQENDDEQD